jgi:hypothetical protein
LVVTRLPDKRLADRGEHPNFRSGSVGIDGGAAAPAFLQKSDRITESLQLGVQFYRERNEA